MRPKAPPRGCRFDPHLLDLSMPCFFAPRDLLTTLACFFFFRRVLPPSAPAARRLFFLSRLKTCQMVLQTNLNHC
jgi:hypothetical protein